MARKLTVALTPVEVWHLVTIMRDAKAEGLYYGPLAQYWTRHDRIMDALLASVDQATALSPERCDEATDAPR